MDVYIKNVPGWGMNFNDFVQIKEMTKNFDQFKQNTTQMSTLHTQIKSSLHHAQMILGDLKKNGKLVLDPGLKILSKEKMVNTINQNIRSHKKLQQKYSKLISILIKLRSDIDKFVQLNELNKKIDKFTHPVQIIFENTSYGFIIESNPYEGYNILNDTCIYRLNYLDLNPDTKSKKPSKDSTDIYSIKSYTKFQSEYKTLDQTIQPHMFTDEFKLLLELDLILNRWLNK